MLSLSITQNFLSDNELVEDLILKTNLCANDVVLDIGAGKGIITRVLARKCKKVIAVEFDVPLFEVLKAEFSSVSNVDLINKNFLDIVLPSTNYKVFSNIPFNITSRVINKLLLGDKCPESAYIVMQKEAAKRFMGEGEGYLISALIKPFYTLSILHEFRPSDFTPSPSVDVVMLALVKKVKSLVPENNKEEYSDFITFVCLQQKPTLKIRLNKLFTHEQFSHLYKECGFTQNTPVKDIDINTWISLFDSFRKYVSETKKNLVYGSYRIYKRTLENAPIGMHTKIKGIKCNEGAS